MNQNYPKHKLALAMVQNTRNRQAENDLQNMEVTSGELTTKSMKAMTQERDAGGAESRISLGINYEKAAAEVLNKVKQDLPTKEIEQGLKQELERQQRNETISMVRPEPETRDNPTVRSNCNTLKMVIGKLFGITKIGERILSIITVGVH